MVSRARRSRASHVGDFLAHGGGAGGLAVRAAEHGHAGVSVRQRLQLRADTVQRRQQHLFARGLQHQRVAGVVDVFAGAGEVHELGRAASSSGWPLNARLDPVLDRLHVVVGGLFDRP
jgi:hypothetical protein